MLRQHSTDTAHEDVHGSPVTPPNSADAQSNGVHQIEKMASFDRQLKDDHSYKNPDLQKHVPFYQKQTAASLLKIKTTKLTNADGSARNFKNEAAAAHGKKKSKRSSKISQGNSAKPEELKSMYIEDSPIEVLPEENNVVTTEKTESEEEEKVTTPSQSEALPKGGSALEGQSSEVDGLHKNESHTEIVEKEETVSPSNETVVTEAQSTKIVAQDVIHQPKPVVAEIVSPIPDNIATKTKPDTALVKDSGNERPPAKEHEEFKHLPEQRESKLMYRQATPVANRSDRARTKEDSPESDTWTAPVLTRLAQFLRIVFCLPTKRVYQI